MGMFDKASRNLIVLFYVYLKQYTIQIDVSIHTHIHKP